MVGGQEAHLPTLPTPITVTSSVTQAFCYLGSWQSHIASMAHVSRE
jgi:hypothetical protein